MLSEQLSRNLTKVQSFSRLAYPNTRCAPGITPPWLAAWRYPRPLKLARAPPAAVAAGHSPQRLSRHQRR